MNEELSGLLSNYFHQNWESEFSSSRESVDRFVSGNPPEVVKGAVKELESLLATTELSRIPTTLARLGSYHYALEPGSEMLPYMKSSDPKAEYLNFCKEAKGWLVEVLNQLKSGAR